ncbi:uncharacterized protein Z520_11685 [Fonsecaea multimorphosa CBS 102226]|uniref:Xylanolytic transcriptional activator regulatory domain-containing protein n=1 Tax=Fonsecaea multimorphosa CBS 102226 TaxID=1442371 RepID=A0A0D2I5W2_9EURO|nr:uncharacterized protein Z520_11685 [Fonsecaea multimorphosa CBS 102226]KIX92656.1 hypothetical protein Z520_11685 [Fonsecaea multimorphosa CBS 102226]
MRSVLEKVTVVHVHSGSLVDQQLIVALDLVLTRMDRLEQTVKNRSRPETVENLNEFHETQKWLAQLNKQTGCFEYYGRTSTFVVALALQKRIKQLEGGTDSPPPGKRLCIGPRAPPVIDHVQDASGLGLNDLTGFSDYVIPSNTTVRQQYRLRSQITDQHVESFFRTIHNFLPVLDVSRFRAKYGELRRLFDGTQAFTLGRGDQDGNQFLCLLYAVLALGAQYEDDKEDSPLWGSWYFAEAQKLLGRLLDAVTLELVQAAMFMACIPILLAGARILTEPKGAYAQHAIKPNLAYNLTGIATRLAFSIGLSIESNYRSPAFDAEEARRTWWIIYIQEVELSLDSGRPMSIHASESVADFSSDSLNLMGTPSVAPLFPETVETLRHDLRTWHASLPVHLRFYDKRYESGSISKEALLTWKARQRSSLRIHYNLATIILLRNSLNPQTADETRSDAETGDHLELLYQISCVDAARDMILHIHQIFCIAPSLSRWIYYCFYCLQAVLVLMMKMVDDNSHARKRRGSTLSWMHGNETEDSSNVQRDLRCYCEMSIDIFEKLKLKAAERCAQVVRSFLGRWESSRARSKHHRPLHLPDQSNRTGPQQRPEDLLQQLGNPPSMAVSEIHMPSTRAATLYNQPRFPTPPSWSSRNQGATVSSQQQERREVSDRAASEGRAMLVVANERDFCTDSTPSTNSLADLYAELASFSALHGSRVGDFNEMDFASDGPASWSALGLNMPVEYVLKSGFGNEEENPFFD